MRKHLNLRANIAQGLIFAFLANTLGPLPLAQAQEFTLPAPGQMVALSPAFNPAVLKGVKLDPKNPFRFHFFVDRGDSSLSQEELKQESSKLIKYFLASLTIPEKDLWVNLSPYEKDRIVPQEFGQTEMGRDLLAEDYILKQITASLIYPESQLGKEFWNKVYAQAQAKYGTTNIPINTFNKVWIVPDKAVVYENNGTAFVLENHLKVMLEQDYLSMSKHQRQRGDTPTWGQDSEAVPSGTDRRLYPSRLPSNEALNVKAPQVNNSSTSEDANALGSQIIREIVIPALTKEVNEGKNFSQLRQVFYSLILATWYKKKIKDSILNKIYSDRNKISGVTTLVSLRGVRATKQSFNTDTEYIYQQYLQAFKKGVYNYIKEEPSQIIGKVIPKKYFSGGVVGSVDPAMSYAEHITPEQFTGFDKAQLTDVAVDFAMNIRQWPVINNFFKKSKEPMQDQELSPAAIKLLRLVVQGDIHGALQEFLDNLYQAKLINQEGHWIGGNAVLIQIGDVVDRGPQSWDAFKYLRMLQAEAEQQGGQVIRLLGNHELMLLRHDFRYVNYVQPEALAEEIKKDVRSGKMKLAHLIGNWTFIHAGFRSVTWQMAQERYARLHKIKISEVSRQGIVEMLNKILLDAVNKNDFNDPLMHAVVWNRDVMESRAASAFGNQVIGHTPGSRVHVTDTGHRVNVDAGLFEGYGGNHSFMEVVGNRIKVHTFNKEAGVWEVEDRGAFISTKDRAMNGQFDKESIRQLEDKILAALEFDDKEEDEKFYRQEYLDRIKQRLNSTEIYHQWLLKCNNFIISFNVGSERQNALYHYFLAQFLLMDDPTKNIEGVSFHPTVEFLGLDINRPKRLVLKILTEKEINFVDEWKTFKSDPLDGRTENIVNFIQKKDSADTFIIGILSQYKNSEHLEGLIVLSDAGQALYAKHLAIAPWNREEEGNRRFKGIGSVLFAATIDESFRYGYQGRFLAEVLSPAVSIFYQMGGKSRILEGWGQLFRYYDGFYAKAALDVIKKQNSLKGNLNIENRLSVTGDEGFQKLLTWRQGSSYPTLRLDGKYYRVHRYNDLKAYFKAGKLEINPLTGIILKTDRISKEELLTLNLVGTDNPNGQAFNNRFHTGDAAMLGQRTAEEEQMWLDGERSINEIFAEYAKFADFANSYEDFSGIRHIVSGEMQMLSAYFLVPKSRNKMDKADYQKLVSQLVLLQQFFDKYSDYDHLNALMDWSERFINNYKKIETSKRSDLFYYINKTALFIQNGGFTPAFAEHVNAVKKVYDVNQVKIKKIAEYFLKRDNPQQISAPTDEAMTSQGWVAEIVKLVKEKKLEEAVLAMKDKELIPTATDIVGFNIQVIFLEVMPENSSPELRYQVLHAVQDILKLKEVSIDSVVKEIENDFSKKKITREMLSGEMRDKYNKEYQILNVNLMNGYYLEYINPSTDILIVNGKKVSSEKWDEFSDIHGAVIQAFPYKDKFTEEVTHTIYVLLYEDKAQMSSQRKGIINFNPAQLNESADSAMVDSIAAGKIERKFGSILESILRSRYGGGQLIDLGKLTDPEWADLRDRFIVDAKKEFGTKLINEDTAHVLEVYFNAEQMKTYKHKFGHLDFNDLVYIAQSLHTLSLTYPEYSLRLEMLGNSIDLESILEKSAFTYSLYLDIWERVGMGNSVWESVTADLNAKKFLAENRIDLLTDNGLGFDDLPKLKAIYEYYGINPEEQYKVFFRALLRDKHVSFQEVNEDFLDKFSGMFKMVLFYDLTAFLTMARHDLSNGIKYEKLLGRGADGMAVLATDRLGRKIVVKINMFYTNEADAKRYMRLLATRKRIFQGQRTLVGNYDAQFMMQQVDSDTKECYVIEYNEFVEGQNLSNLIKNSNNVIERLKLINKYVDLNKKLYESGYVNRDIFNIDNVIVKTYGVMRIVDLRNVVDYDKLKRLEYKKDLIRTIVKMLVKQAISDFDQDYIDLVKELNIVDSYDDSVVLESSSRIITFILSAYNDDSISYQDFLKEWDRIISPMVSGLDKAQVSSPRKGGIDLNPAQMRMQVKKEGEDFKFDFNGTEIDTAQVTGVTFTIRSMTPVTDLHTILGLNQDPSDKSLAKA